jgi:hypothetical protein
MPLNPDGTWSNENTGYDQNYFNNPVVPNQVDPLSALPTDYSGVGSDFLYNTLGLGSIDYLNNKSPAIAHSDWGQTDADVGSLNQDYSDIGSDFLQSTLGDKSMDYKNTGHNAIAYSDWGPADKGLGENLVTHDVDSMVGEGFGGHSVDDYMYSDNPELNPWLQQYQVDTGPHMDHNWVPYDVDTGQFDPSLFSAAINNQTGTMKTIPDWREGMVPIEPDPVALEEPVVGAEGGDTPVVAGADGEPPVKDKGGPKKGTHNPYGWKPGQSLIDFASSQTPFQYKLM